jgi:hypothetical protein
MRPDLYPSLGENQSVEDWTGEAVADLCLAQGYGDAGLVWIAEQPFIIPVRTTGPQDGRA